MGIEQEGVVLEDVVLDGMTVHPDWNHIETLLIHPDTDSLVIVPGHASFIKNTIVSSADFDPLNKKYWSLNKYQDEREISMLIDHIRYGVLTSARTLNSALIFSGGCTRLDAGNWTEGASYFCVAQHYHWWEKETQIPEFAFQQRVMVDSLSFDSFENLYKSIAMFSAAHPRHELPKKVFVVGWGFKHERFEFHAKTLGIPEFLYIPMPDPANYKDDARAHERESELIQFYELDPFGDREGGYLEEKKRARNIHNVTYSEMSAREIAQKYKELAVKK